MYYIQSMVYSGTLNHHLCRSLCVSGLSFSHKHYVDMLYKSPILQQKCSHRQIWIHFKWCGFYFITVVLLGLVANFKGIKWDHLISSVIYEHHLSIKQAQLEDEYLLTVKFQMTSNKQTTSDSHFMILKLTHDIDQQFILHFNSPSASYQFIMSLRSLIIGVLLS